MPTRLFTISMVLMREYLREPLSLVWNLALPIILFLMFQASGSRGPGVGSLTDAGAPYLSYIVFSSAVYGCGMAVVWHREAGFLRSFVQRRGALVMIQVAQIFSAAVIAGLNLAVFFVAAAALGVVDHVAAIRLFAGGVALAFIFALASLSLNALDVTARAAKSLISLTLVPLLIGAFSKIPETALLSAPLATANLFNPIAFGRDFLQAVGHGALDCPTAVRLAVGASFLMVLAILGLAFRRVRPTEQRG